MEAVQRMKRSVAMFSQGRCEGCPASMLCMTGSYTPYAADCVGCGTTCAVLRKSGEPLCFSYVRGIFTEETEDLKCYSILGVRCKPPRSESLRFFCPGCKIEIP